MIVTSIKVDMTRFNYGFNLAMTVTSRLPSEAVNFAAKEVAFGAYANTPVTGADRVVSDLDVIGVPIIGKRGKQIKKKSSNYIANTGGSEPPFAALLVNARVTSPK